MLQNFLYKTFVKNFEDTGNVGVRRSYGTLVSITGIIANAALAAGKLTIGFLSGSVAITADGFNNFADTASSIVSLFSFRAAAKPADADHPFGHARIEYIAASVVGLFTLLIAYELGRSSIEKILNPAPVHFTWVYVAVLIVSIIVKFWLYRFNKSTGRRIDSPVMGATAVDSLSDVLVTSLVLVALITGLFTGFPVDGVVGVVVALFILRAGYSVLKGTINALIGERPSEELSAKILAFVKQEPLVLGAHDLVVHDYGPGRTFTSIHVEVDANKDILVLHEAIDRIEREIGLAEGISLVIHMDPIVTNDPRQNELRAKIEELVTTIDSRLSIHDFRMVPGATRTNLIFDVTVPSGFALDDETLKRSIDAAVRMIGPEYYAVVVFDREFASLPHNAAK